LVNRRVLESLIKAGAFDSLGLPRAHLLATADAALEAGQRQQREQAEGQGSFFELLGASPPARAAPAPVTPEWDPDQLLQFEKEVLGFYLSGHPLARFRSLAESLGVTGSGDLAARSAGARVLLLGQVVSLKETATKSGSRMAFATLEDMDGTVEVTVFPEAYRAAAEHLRSRQPLLVRGRLDDGDRGRVVLAEEVRPLEQALGSGPSAAPGSPPTLHLHLEPPEEPAAVMASLRALCARYPGPAPVFLHVHLPDHEVVIRARAVAVDPSPELLRHLERLLGPAAVAVDHAGPA
jgi:DNA polymerase-3 subunit alpha